jgi:MFS family permease
MPTVHADRPSRPLRAVIILAATTQTTAYAVVTPLLSRMSNDFSGGPMDAYMIKMMLGVLGPSMVVGAALGGFLADRDRRTTMIGAGLLFAIAGAAPFVLQSLPLILATRVLTGLAAAAVATIGATMIGDHFSEEDRPGWMGVLGFVTMVSGFAMFPAAGLLGELGWRWPFLLYLVGLLIAALAWAAMSPRRQPPQEAVSVAPPAATGGGGGGSWRNYPIRLFVIGVMAGPVFSLQAIYLPFHLRKFGFDGPAAVGGLLALSAVAAATCAALYGRARRRLSVRFVFASAFGCGTLGLGLVALAPNVILAAVGVGLIGIGAGWATPNLYSAVIDAV